MAVGDGPELGDKAPGLPQLGVRLLIGAGVVLLLLLVAQRWGASDRMAEAAFPTASGTIRLVGLPAPVELLRDARGLPHVFAEAEREGWFGLGFAHAQDRLAQMIAFRRQALGRTAEVVGEAGLRADRLARLLEIERAARAEAEALPEAERAVLEAYAAGVNARLARLRQGRIAPPSALAEPVADLSPWRPADSLALVKLLSWCIGGTLETTLVLDDLIQRLESVPARPFFPGRAAVDFGVAPEIPRHPVSLLSVSGPLADAVVGASDALCRGVGLPTGGAWLLGGGASESGAPIVVADWHVPPVSPPLFYEARVAAGAIDVAGATLPGVPIFWTGRSPQLAWAAVPASAPVSDLFIETLRGDGRYQNGSQWAPIDERVETLRWTGPRGDPREEKMTLRSTRHGPLIRSLWADIGPGDGAGDDPETTAASGSRSARALSWTGARPGNGLGSMLALLRAGDTEAVEAALAAHHEPVLAFVWAEAGGAGGAQVAGWLPNRPLPTGLVPVQGRLRSFDWRERVELAGLPGERLPPGARGWALALDQPWPTRGGLDQTEWLWRPGDRATRLDALLRERSAPAADGLDLRAAVALMSDDRAPRGKPVVTAIVGLARRVGPLSVEAEEIATLLERWDGRLAADSAGAAAYHLMIERLLEHLLRAPFGDGLFERYLGAPHVRPQSAIERLILRAATLRAPGGWTDEAQVTAALRRALRETWVAMNHRLGPTRERWAWGELHRLPFLPATLRRPSVAGVSPIATLRAPGSAETLAYARHAPGRSFEVGHAALYRVGFDLGTPGRFLSALAPGQSEHPGHPRRLDGLQRFREARLALVATSRLVIEEESPSRLVLEPSP